MTKRCNGECKQILPLNEFYNNKSSKDGYDGKCIKCSKIYREKYKQRNSIKVKDWHRKHKSKLEKYYNSRYQNNKEYYFDYIKDNEDKIIKYQNNYRNKRYKNDIEFRIKILLRSHLNHALKKGEGEKFISCIKLLGCSIKKFKEHILNKFKPEMNWSNHGEIWELDHIKPCDSFNLKLEEEQQKCFHYTNYQPLFKTTEIAESFGYYDQIGNRNKSNKL